MQHGINTCQQNLIGKATGFIALAVAVFSLANGWHDPITVIASLFFVVICITDTLHAKIFNSSNLLMCLSGLTYQIYTHGLAGFSHAGLGLLTGLSLLIIPYIMGGVGGGDVKALTALGTLVGPKAIFEIFLYIGLIGGVIALFHFFVAASHDKSKMLWNNWAASALALFCTSKPLLFMTACPQNKLRFPYAPAITLGFFAFTAWGNIL